MVRAALAVTLCVLCLAGALTPLTEIAPSESELSAFAATVSGALKKLGLGPRRGKNARAKRRRLGLPFVTRKLNPVVHLIGASKVEAAVDWQPVCGKAEADGGAKILLVGPQAVVPVVTEDNNSPPPPPQDRAVQHTDTDGCVKTVHGLYSRDLVRTALAKGGGGSSGGALADPDVIILHNADLYMSYWRRTLAELLHSGKSVVLTLYCEDEGAKMERLLKWPEVEFSATALAQCDSQNKQLWPDQLEPVGDVGNVPEPRILWGFQPNPHSHKPASDCYSGKEHGVRNAYWMAFTGAPAPAITGEL